MTTALPATAVP